MAPVPSASETAKSIAGTAEAISIAPEPPIIRESGQASSGKPLAVPQAVALLELAQAGTAAGILQPGLLKIPESLTVVALSQLADAR
jgi:hypothetical protein